MRKIKPKTARDLLRQLAAAGKLPLAKYMELDKALESSGHADDNTAGLHRRMLDAIAKFAYVLAWAFENERRAEDGRKHVHIPGGSRIEDYVPERTPASARKYAKELAEEYREVNDGLSIEALFLLALIADPNIDMDDAEEFAQDLVYESQGAGVSWFDDHAGFDLQVPDTEYYI